MADNPLLTYSYPASEYTTPDEMRQERISQALGWDTSRPGREFGIRAVTQLPLALRTSAGATRMNAAVATEGRAFDDYFNAFGYPPAPGMSVDAMRRWVDWRRGGTQTQPLPPSPQARSSGPTQAQRDFHALDPRGGAGPGEGLEYWRAQGAASGLNPRLAPLGDPRRALDYSRVMREFENLPRPPNNRLNALLPFAGAAGAFVPDEPY